MSDYNLTIFDLEEGREYEKENDNNKYNFWKRDGSELKSVSKRTGQESYEDGYDGNTRFKEIKPEPELVELKLYKTRLGLIFTSSHVIPQSLVPYQIKDGKIFIERSK